MNQEPKHPYSTSGHAGHLSVPGEASAFIKGVISTHTIALSIVILFFLIAGIIAWLSYRQYETVRNKALNADRMTSELLAIFIREHEKAIADLLQSYADRGSFASALTSRDLTALQWHLTEFKKNQEVDWAIVTDYRGIIQTQSPFPQMTGRSFTSEIWFKEAQKRKKLYISPVIKFPDSRKTPAVALCTPARNEQGDIIGFVIAVQKLDFINDSVAKLQLTDHAGVSVVDDNGFFLFSNCYVYFESPFRHPDFSAAAKAFKGNLRQIRVRERGSYLSITAVATTGWKVFVERSEKDILQEAYGNFVEIFVGGGLLFACLSVCLIYLRKVFLLRQTRALLHAEVKCRQSEQRFKELFENMSSGVAVFRADRGGGDFIFKDINQAALRLEGINRPDAIGHSVCEVFKGVREFGLFDLLHRVWLTGVAEYVAAWYYREDRRRGWKQNSVYRLPSGDVVMIFHDISKSKRAEETLKRSEETFSKVFKANPAAIAIFRQRDGYILDVNAAFENLTGYTREELIGKTDQDSGLWVDVHERESVMKVLSEQSSIADQEVHIRTRTGKTLITRYSAEKVRLETESCLLSIIVDITAARQAEEERLKLERQLYESQKMEAVGTLAAGIAHDFNNILGAVIGYAEMAVFQPDHKKLKRYMDQILIAGLRAKDLTSQILTFSRRQEHDKNLMDLKIITKEILKLLRSTMPSMIEIRQHIENLPLTIKGNLTQMHQVIMNICINAAHAMGEKGGVLEFRLAREKLSLPEAGKLQLQPGDYVRLTISDTGCGIEPAIIGRIFDPFFTTKKKGEGTGLGLAVVYSIVKNHEGCIRVNSEPGKGTSFDVYLPYLESCLPVSADPPVSYIVKGGQERILFVDDEKPLVDLARRNLSALGYDVVACSDSEEALDIFQSDPYGFDLIITDMTMPKISGSELSRQISDLCPGQPIILCTGYSDYINPEKAAQMGIKEFILKPMSRRTLANAVRKVLDDYPAGFARRAGYQS